MGIFIEITVDESHLDHDLKQRLVSLCPVDIFVLNADHLTVDPEQEDECTLCALCLDAAPPAAVCILKTYNGEILRSRGGGAASITPPPSN